MARITDQPVTKGNCGHNALNTLLVDPEGPLQSLAVLLKATPKLCHGFPTVTDGPDKGKVGFHAWIEIGPVVIDCGSGPKPVLSVFHQLVYYTAGKIKPEYVAKYTDRQALQLADDTEHCGPWHTNLDPNRTERYADDNS